MFAGGNNASFRICEVHTSEAIHCYNGEIQSWNDARLIAAAPDLLEGCRVAIAHCLRCNEKGHTSVQHAPGEFHDEPCDACTAAREAVSKAESQNTNSAKG